MIIGGVPPYWGAFPKRFHLSLWGRVWLTLSNTVHRLRGGVGSFGWDNKPIPEAVWVVWAIVFVVLLCVGLYRSGRSRRALPVLALAIIVLPVIFESPTIDIHGIWWQGRYWLPLLVGVPLVALSKIRTREEVHRRADDRTTVVGVVVLGVILIVAQIWTFIFVLQWYEHGLGAAPGTAGRWAPPGGAAFVTGLFIFGMVLFLGFIVFNCVNVADRRSGHAAVDLEIPFASASREIRA